MGIRKWNRGIRTVARIAEIIYFVLAAALVALAVASVVRADTLGGMIILSNGGDASVGTNGFEIAIADRDGNAIPAAVTLIAVVGIVTMFCMAMIFRNIRLIFAAAQGVCRTDGALIFTPDIVRLVREIGTFCMAIPLAGFAALAAGRLIIGPGLEASVQLHGLAIGFAVLCLSRFFAYGAELEHEVEGLV
ncbi:MAG: hypothetical protein K2N31_04660 [Treponemataceae bacterium]|nr:hypothetical protein [Treponemataceae bacterium]